MNECNSDFLRDYGPQVVAQLEEVRKMVSPATRPVPALQQWQKLKKGKTAKDGITEKPTEALAEIGTE